MKIQLEEKQLVGCGKVSQGKCQMLYCMWFLIFLLDAVLKKSCGGKLQPREGP